MAREPLIGHPWCRVLVIFIWLVSAYNIQIIAWMGSYLTYKQGLHQLYCQVNINVVPTVHRKKMLTSYSIETYLQTVLRININKFHDLQWGNVNWNKIKVHFIRLISPSFSIKILNFTYRSFIRRTASSVYFIAGCSLILKMRFYSVSSPFLLIFL